MKKSLILLFGLVLALVSCKNETENYNASVDDNYFPDDSGTWVEYRVDSVVYNDFYYAFPPSSPQPQYVHTSTHYIKQVVGEKFTDNMGRQATKLYRYTKDSLSQAYDDVPRVWYFVKTKANVEVVEENLRYIKLVFPANVDLSWKGNKYVTDTFPFVPLKGFFQINYNGWDYAVSEKDKIYNNGFQTFDSVLTVVQYDDSTNVYKVSSVEKYARNTGMVYREFWRLDAQQDTDDNTPLIPFMQSKLNGFIVKQYAINYGH